MMIKKTRSNNLTVIMGIKHMINPLNLITTLMMTYMMTIDLLRSFINFFLKKKFNYLKKTKKHYFKKFI